MKLFLIGYMGSGKTTHGRKLAALLGYHFIDTDNLIEINAGKSIPEIFTEDGESFFRKMEHDIIKEIVNNDNIVVSTGGGTPCHYNNMELMNKAGISIYIKMSPESLAMRLMNSKNTRPLIRGIGNTELPNTISKNLLERESFYNQAKYCIRGENLRVVDLYKYINIIISETPTNG